MVIDPLTTEAILGLDVLSQCTVDLLHKQLITGVGHVVTLDCQEPNMKLSTDFVNFDDSGTANSEIVNSEIVNSETVSSEPVIN